MRLIKIGKFVFKTCLFGALLIVSTGISHAGQIKILIAPAPIIVAPGQSVKLRARLVNLPANARVKWSLDAVGVPDHQTGKLDQDFMPVYTAPDKPPSKPVYVQILALGAVEGIPLAGAKSRIQFISGSAGGGGDRQSSSGEGQGSQNTGNSGGRLGESFGGNRTLGWPNPRAQGQPRGGSGSSGDPSPQSSASGGKLWNSPSSKSGSAGSEIIWNSPSGSGPLSGANPGGRRQQPGGSGSLCGPSSQSSGTGGIILSSPSDNTRKTPSWN
jgi:hypothetical protein